MAFQAEFRTSAVKVQNSTGNPLPRHPRQPVMEALWQGDVGSHRASAWKVTDPALQSYDSYDPYVILSDMSRFWPYRRRTMDGMCLN